MRNLDELLQDIPLEELLNDRVENKGKTHRSKRAVSRDDDESPVIQLKSRVSVAAAAAVIAVIAAITAAVSMKMEYGTRIEPRAQTEKNQPDPIMTESESDSSQINANAERLHKAMLSYMSQYPDSEVSDAAENYIYVDMEDIEGENGELGLKLEKLMQKDLPGESFFVFENGRLLYTEWSDCSSASAKAELYPEINGRKTVASVGTLLNNVSDLGMGLDYNSRVCIQRNGAEPHYENISSLPWLTEWYEAFLKADPEETVFDDQKQHELLFDQPQTETENSISIYFNYGGSIVTVSTPPNIESPVTVTVSGKYYDYGDTSVFSKAAEYL